MAENNLATALTDTSAGELPAAVAAISGGDEVASRFALNIRRAVDLVNAESRKAIGEHARLHGDDLMNVAGKSRLLSELPGALRAATMAQLDQAYQALGIIEDLHLGAVLRHDGRNDGSLRWEIDHHVAGTKPEIAVESMVRLAANPRYATFLSGAAGDALAARFGFDPAILQKVALQSLATNGTEDQIARSRALAALPAMRRAVDLAKAGRDHVASEVQRSPKRKPSAAMM